MKLAVDMARPAGSGVITVEKIYALHSGSLSDMGWEPVLTFGDGRCTIIVVCNTNMLIRSYRSVHNTRIERMWVDVTQAFGAKWKSFFRELEEFHGLNPKRDGHIWLLHHLFLQQIDGDAQDFVATWNHHKMQIRDQRTASPREMFFFGMLQAGLRGMEDVTNFDMYGVDWEDYNNASFMRNLQDAHPEDQGDIDNFRAPSHINEVNCEPPNCPLSPEEVTELDRELDYRLGEARHSRDMSVRRATWDVALAFVMDLVSEGMGGCHLYP
jgi:hypothetical protein